LTYLFDTNTCIAIMTGRTPAVRSRFQALPQGPNGAVSTITVFELWYGAPNSARAVRNRLDLSTFLLPLTVLEFGEQDARAAGELRAELKRSGRPIGPYDLLIAAQARARGLTIVTANEREFRNVPGLAVEDWTSA
jgi:tRNA(fMet)-specific endonuclease VapC